MNRWSKFIGLAAALVFGAAYAQAPWVLTGPPAPTWVYGGGSTPTAYLMFLTGQSTGAGVEPVYASGTCSTTGSVLTCPGAISGGPIQVGSAVNCAQGAVGLGHNAKITIMSGGAGCGSTCTGTGTGSGTYAISDATTVASGTCYFVPTSVLNANGVDQYTAITTSLPYNNAYMISAGGSSPRAIVDPYTIAVTNQNLPMNSNAGNGWGGWSGFTGLRANSYPIQGYIGAGFFTEDPLPAMAAQAMAATSFRAQDALIGINVAKWSVGWALGGCAPAGGYSQTVIGQCVSPGSGFYADASMAQLYAKQQIQYGTNALSNNPGSLPTQLYAIGYRQGEAADAIINYTANALFTTASTSVVMTLSNTNDASNVHVGDAIWDNTASCWVGYVHSFSGTTLTFAGNDSTGAAVGSALCAGSASDVLYFSEAGNLKNELADVVTEYNSNGFDRSDAPTGNVPVVALQPSTNSGNYSTFAMQTFAMPFVYEALADRRFILAGPSYPGEYIDAVHNSARGNALLGAYMGKWLGWWKLGRRTVPFIMTQATTIAPNAANCDATHYCIRVTFQAPPTNTAAEAALQFYCSNGTYCTTTDAKIPYISVTNNYMGFSYTDSTSSSDGRVPGPTSSIFNCNVAAGSGITITAAKLATSETNPGAANQIDLVTSSTAIDPATRANPTVCYAGAASGNQFWWGSGAQNVNLQGGNVADRACDKPADTALLGNAFKNAACTPSDSNPDFLIDFAAQSVVTIGAPALAPAW